MKTYTPPTLEELDKVRRRGYRPGVSACFVNDKTALLLFKKEFKVWMFPQGGIDNKTDIYTALTQNITTELGPKLLATITPRLTQKIFPIVYYSELTFSKTKWGLKELSTDSGDKIKMIGKAYYFFAIPIETKTIDLSETQFDDYFWLTYSAAKFLTKSRSFISNKGDILNNALETLKLLNYIA